MCDTHNLIRTSLYIYILCASFLLRSCVFLIYNNMTMKIKRKISREIFLLIMTKNRNERAIEISIEHDGDQFRFEEDQDVGLEK